MKEDRKRLIDYFYRLAKKKKIVYVKEVQNNEKTPKKINHSLLSGGATGKLTGDYAVRKGLRCKTTKLGSVRCNSIIVFLEQNRRYVELKEIERTVLMKKIEKLKENIKELEIKISLTGK